MIVYLDDIIVFSQDIPEHLRQLEIVFKKLHEHGLKLKPKKCQFFCSKVNYLGHMVSADGVTTDSDKTEVVRNWPKPSTGFIHNFKPKNSRTFQGLSRTLC